MYITSNDVPYEVNSYQADHDLLTQLPTEQVLEAYTSDLDQLEWIAQLASRVGLLDLTLVDIDEPFQLELTRLPPILTLVIKYSNLIALPEQLPHTINLYLEEMPLTHIPAYPRLQTLVAINTELEELEVYPRVTHLHVAGARLQEIPTQPRCRYMHVGSNPLVRIAAQPRLVELNCEYSALQYLPPPRYLPKLKVLNCLHSRVELIPAYPGVHVVTEAEEAARLLALDNAED